MDKKEASIALNDEILDLLLTLEKARAVSRASEEYIFFDSVVNEEEMKKKIMDASCLTNVLADYINQAYALVSQIGDDSIGR